MRRLARDRPDVLGEIKAGERYAHRAMVGAGFRRVYTPLLLLREAWSEASPKERAALLQVIERLHEG